MAIECDIAIIGAGPGGLAAALAARQQADVSVVLIERKQRWGCPVQCAGYAPRLLGRILPFDSAAVRSRVDSLRLLHSGELLKDVRSPGYILHRDVLESQAAQEAQKAGVRLMHPARVVALEHSRLLVQDSVGTHELRARVIIGADGPRSMVRRAMGLPEQTLAMGLEYELRLGGELTSAEIHFHERYGAGYAWIFPHGDGTAGVGLALDPGQYAHLRLMLQSFIEDQAAQGRIINEEPRRVIAGPVPISGPVEPTVAGAMMLVGDAAGQINPLTGAGIYNAAACGQIAGRLAARAVAEDDFDLLAEYETEWRDLLDLLLIRALRGREAVIASTDSRAHLERMSEAWNIRRFKRNREPDSPS